MFFDYSEKDPLQNFEEKRTELFDFLKDFETEEHNYTESEYNYLDEDEILHCIKNPYNGNDINMVFSQDFTLHFGSCVANYPFTEHGFNYFIKDLKDITTNQLCAVSVFSSNRWIGNALINQKDIDTLSQDDLIHKVVDMPMFEDEIRIKGGRIEIEYWDKARNNAIVV